MSTSSNADANNHTDFIPPVELSEVRVEFNAMRDDLKNRVATETQSIPELNPNAQTHVAQQMGGVMEDFIKLVFRTSELNVECPSKIRRRRGPQPKSPHTPSQPHASPVAARPIAPKRPGHTSSPETVRGSIPSSFSSSGSSSFVQVQHNHQEENTPRGERPKPVPHSAFASSSNERRQLLVDERPAHNRSPPFTETTQRPGASTCRSSGIGLIDEESQVPDPESATSSYLDIVGEYEFGDTDGFNSYEQ